MLESDFFGGGEVVNYDPIDLLKSADSQVYSLSKSLGELVFGLCIFD